MPDTMPLSVFMTKHYAATGKQLRRCHPSDLISQAIDHINFKRLPCELSEDVLDKAFASCFVLIRDLSET